MKGRGKKLKGGKRKGSEMIKGRLRKDMEGCGEGEMGVAETGFRDV